MKTPKTVRALAKKLWTVGYREKVRVQGWDAKCKWANLPEEQHAAWNVIAQYVLTMKRPNAKSSDRE